LNYNIKDENQTELEMLGNGYSLIIDKNYFYNTDFVYLVNSNRSGDYKNLSEDTKNNLVFNSYAYEDKYEDLQTVDLNSAYEYTIDNIIADIGYYLNVSSNIVAKDLFSNYDPKIKTNIFGSFAQIETPVYSYYDGYDYIINIENDNISEDGNIYTGVNNLNFTVQNIHGEKLEDVSIKYQFDSGSSFELGETDQDGKLENQEIFIPLDRLSEEIDFIFDFSSDSGLENNSLKITRTIRSNYSIQAESYPLNFIAHILEIDGIEEVSITKQNYNLVKNTNYSPVLKSVSFEVLDSEYTNMFDKQNIDLELEEENNFEKMLYDNYNSIVTSLILDQNNITQTVYDINAMFNNVIKIDYEDIVVNQLLSIPILIDIVYEGDMVFVNQTDLNYGYIDINSIGYVEFISGYNEDMNVSYNLRKSEDSLSTVTIDDIDVTGGGNLVNPQIIKDYLSSYVGQEVTTEGINILIPFNLLSSNTGSSDLDIKFTLNFENQNSSKTKDYIKEINIKSFSKNSILDLENTLGNLPINCTNNDCTDTLIYNIYNNTKTYDFEFSGFSGEGKEENVPLIISDNYVADNIPKDGNSTLMFDVSSDYNYLINEYLGYFRGQNLGIDLNLEFQDELISDQLININLNAYDITYPVSSSSFEIQDNFCLGVGGMVSGNDIYILANCQTENNNCKTGDSFVPKVIYNWTGNINDNLSWKTACVSESENYDTTGKYYCDSSQMLFTLFHKLEDNTDPFYIYLLADGVSDDLLNDLIDYHNLYRL
jgi:hypothetical protein